MSGAQRRGLSVLCFIRIRHGEIDPSFIITHRFSLDQAPEAYELFHEKRDGCIKVVLKP